jgi:hypothetical protein
MPSADPFSDPGPRAVIGATLLALVWFARQVLGFVSNLLREIRTNVNWWMTRDQRWARETAAAKPTPRVVGLSGASTWSSDMTGALTLARRLDAWHSPVMERLRSGGYPAARAVSGASATLGPSDLTSVARRGDWRHWASRVAI